MRGKGVEEEGLQGLLLRLRVLPSNTPAFSAFKKTQGRRVKDRA